MNPKVDVKLISNTRGFLAWELCMENVTESKHLVELEQIKDALSSIVNNTIAKRKAIEHLEKKSVMKKEKQT